MAENSSAVEVWEGELQGEKYHGAYGLRDVLIIRSSESLKGPDVVPRKKGTLTTEDREVRLISQGISQEHWGDDVQVMEARYKRGGRYDVLPTKCEDYMSCQVVLGKIKAHMNNTTKPGGTAN